MSLDFPSFPTKNPIFQHSIFNISGFLKFKFINFCKVHLPLHLFPKVFLIICCEVCKISFYCCIEVKDKHRVCPSSVMAQNTEYIGLHGISQLCCDVTLTLRIHQTYTKCLSWCDLPCGGLCHWPTFYARVTMVRKKWLSLYYSIIK